jgi:biopolymer transport protein ExbD
MKGLETLEDTTKPNLMPMIDVVFLMLSFFMVTTQLIRQEADLGIQLPTEAVPTAAVELPSRHIIDVLPDGSILLNGGPTGDAANDPNLTQLRGLLGQLRASADRMRRQTVVIIQADPFSPHYRSVEVLNACSAAQIRFVSFSRF